MNEFILKIRKAFPGSLEKDADILASEFTCTLNPPLALSPRVFRVFVENESLEIPERIYFDEKCLEVGIMPIQKDMLNTLFSRHYDGYELTPV